MLKSAILALIRQILTVAGTALVAKGYAQASNLEPVIGALLTIASVIWERFVTKCRVCLTLGHDPKSMKMLSFQLETCQINIV